MTLDKKYVACAVLEVSSKLMGLSVYNSAETGMYFSVGFGAFSTFLLRNPSMGRWSVRRGSRVLNGTIFSRLSQLKVLDTVSTLH